MAGFSVKVVFSEDVREKLGAILPRAVEGCVKALTVEVRDQVVLNCTGRVLKVRSGDLHDSWSMRFSGDGEGTTGYVYSAGIGYSAIHEYGGTVRPVNAHMLAIPLSPMRTPAGAAKAAARDVRAAPGAYGYRSTFRGIRLKDGSRKHPNIIFGAKPSGGIEAIFVLKPEVTIPARRYVTLALEAAVGRADALTSAATIRAIHEVA